MRKRRNKRATSLLLLVGLTAALVLFRFVSEIGPEQQPDSRFVVARILDGDTVELAGGDRLRLLAIDTPERGELFHDRATEFLARKALGQIAEIRYASRRRDKYGRLLGYLYVDSTFINREIIDSGYGNVYLFRDNERSSGRVRQLLEAQTRAIDSRLGIWSTTYEPEPVYLASRSSFRLHRPGCRALDQDNLDKYLKYDTKEEAFKLGLSPCRICRP